MSIDMKENKNNYMIKVDLPGAEKSAIDISIDDNNTLTISCEKTEELEENDEKSKYYYSERSYGSQSRSITIPSNIDIDNVTADYINGVLKINLPKTSKNIKTKTLKIN
jgi:HSP20 family protein